MEVIKVGRFYVWQEEQPYRKCPNCDKYQFRTVEKKKWISTSSNLYEKVINFSYGFWFRYVPFGEWKILDSVDVCDNCCYKENNG